MRTLNIFHKQEFLPRENKLLLAFRRLGRKLHLKEVAKYMKVTGNYPPYPYYGI